MTGRKSEYTPEIASKICERLADGVSLRTVCSDSDMPSMTTVFNWLSKYEEFVEQYTRATLARADAKFEELDVVSEQAAQSESAVTVAGLRLKADNIKWQLARMNAKKYGDKMQHAGADGGPLVVNIVRYSDEQE
jgi:hypothetical protein